MRIQDPNSTEPGAGQGLRKPRGGSNRSAQAYAVAAANSHNHDAEPNRSAKEEQGSDPAEDRPKGPALRIRYPD